MELLMAMPIEPPSCMMRLLREVVVDVCAWLTALSIAVDTGDIRKLMPRPRTIMADMINRMAVPVSIKANSTKDTDNKQMPNMEMLRIIPLSASLPAMGRVTNMINALGNNSRALCSSVYPR